MFVLCKKDVVDYEKGNEVSYKAGEKYEAKIVADDDLLAKGNSGEFALIGVSPEDRKRIGIKDGTSKWGSWFDEHFEVIVQ